MAGSVPIGSSAILRALREATVRRLVGDLNFSSYGFDLSCVIGNSGQACPTIRQAGRRGKQGSGAV